MRRLLLIIFLLWGALSATNYHDFDVYQDTLSRKEVEERINRFLRHDPGVEDYYEITNHGLYLFSSFSKKLKGDAEYFLRFGHKPKVISQPLSLKSTKAKPLNGIRIAIDPGHLGGDMAQIEDRFIDMVIKQEPHDTRATFDEGTLAVLTALALQKLLVAVGATVMLTKEKPGQAVYHQPFLAWCKQKDHADSKGLFKQYNNLDLKARADKINQFKPDLTVVIHYNANCNAPGTVTDSNYNVVFIPGGFLDNELSSLSSRYEFLRLVVTSDLQQSLELSKSIVQAMTVVLQVPLMRSVFYMAENALFITDGIYSRNLMLTRLIHGPICYGETLIQNNREEALKLALHDIEIDGIPAPSRVLDVARAYFAGICNYYLTLMGTHHLHAA